VLPPDLARIPPAFDALPLAADPFFGSVVERRKLRSTGKNGSPDLIDNWSARLDPLVKTPSSLA